MYVCMDAGLQLDMVESCSAGAPGVLVGLELGADGGAGATWPSELSRAAGIRRMSGFREGLR